MANSDVAGKLDTVLQRLLLPFSWLYARILHLRHWLYDANILKSTRPAVPTIVVGNLSFGGTGKTPHTELILRSLADVQPLATLSRGYGREGNAVVEVLQGDRAHSVGDEPLQIKRKFPPVRVFVGADRVKAIGSISATMPGVRAIVLDDAFQHRRLQAGLNILLTTWAKPWHRDALVPAGTLRDVRSRSRAAQAVVVTKCPQLPAPIGQAQWRKDLGLLPEQALFFSGLRYAAPHVIHSPEAPTTEVALSGKRCLVVTGIADPAPFVDHVRSLGAKAEHLRFPDHHTFTPADLRKAAERLATFAPGPQLLVTTEKDAMRLLPHLQQGPLAKATIVVIGVEAVILNDHDQFIRLLHDHVGTHQAHG